MLISDLYLHTFDDLFNCFHRTCTDVHGRELLVLYDCLILIQLANGVHPLTSQALI
jgi:hypothetical protein